MARLHEIQFASSLERLQTTICTIDVAADALWSLVLGLPIVVIEIKMILTCCRCCGGPR
jgi:hypothetical protein